MELSILSGPHIQSFICDVTHSWLLFLVWSFLEFLEATPYHWRVPWGMSKSRNAEKLSLTNYRPIPLSTFCSKLLKQCTENYIVIFLAIKQTVFPATTRIFEKVFLLLINSSPLFTTSVLFLRDVAYCAASNKVQKLPRTSNVTAMLLRLKCFSH